MLGLGFDHEGLSLPPALERLRCGPETVEPVPAEDRTQLLTQIRAILTHENLAPLFAPGSLAEQPVTGIAQGQVVLGQVDRLCVTPRQVMLCDYKTGQKPPRPGQAVPAAYRRQMNAYGAVLSQLYPDHEIVLVLVWTEGPTLSFVPFEP